MNEENDYSAARQTDTHWLLILREGLVQQFKSIVHLHQRAYESTGIYSPSTLPGFSQQWLVPTHSMKEDLWNCSSN